MTLSIDLRGKKGLIVGIANKDSIAYGCARAFQAAGAELAITYLNAKAEPYVRPLAEALSAPIILPCDVTEDGQLDDVFLTISQCWGKLDFLLHSIAFAPRADLQGRVTDSSKQGFAQALDISCHSFIRMAKCAEALMPHGGSLLTVSYMGGREVVEHYGIMGPVKAALESAALYLAAELGPKGIRVNTLCPGAIPTRAAGGIVGFDAILHSAAHKSPLGHGVEAADVGAMAAFLVSDLARNITGGRHVVDAGYEMMD